MIYNGNNEIAYNDFSGIEEIPYRVLTWLISNKTKVEEDMWKALYYSDYDALKKKNLTTAQKRGLIWTKEPMQNQFKVFNTPLVSDDMVDADDMIQLRMFEYSLIPVDRLHATILFEIDVYTNDKSSTIVKENNIPVERTSFIEVCLLQLLVGVDLGLGYNFLQFDRNLSTYSKSVANINNSKSFWGRSFMLALQYSKPNNGGDCSA
jgi:hypothetical protein